MGRPPETAKYSESLETTSPIPSPEYEDAHLVSQPKLQTLVQLRRRWTGLHPVPQTPS